MSSIKVIEEVVEAFVNKDMKKVTSILKKESIKSRKANRTSMARRLDNLIKKIPANNVFASSGTINNDSRYRSIVNFNNNPNLVSEFESDILPEQVILDNEAKKSIKTLFQEWEERERLQKFGLMPINKVLLYGPPGTGKTKLAYSIANQLQLPLVLIRLDELISSYLGKTGQNIREIFDMAKDRDIILFLDEIDTIGKHRTDERDLGELKRIVTVLLQNVDLFPNNSLIIGATNHDEILDKAIWRRFPLKIKLNLPSDKSRKLMFSLFLDNVKKKIDIDLLVNVSSGLSGSEIFDLSQQGIKNYIISGKDFLTDVDMINAYFQLLLNDYAHKNVSKINIYKLCQKLKDEGFKLREIEKITKIPYTTLRDNIK